MSETVASMTIGASMSVGTCSNMMPRSELGTQATEVVQAMQYAAKHSPRAHIGKRVVDHRTTMPILCDVCNGCAPCKGGAFQWVQIPPGNRSSRKQSEQSWR